MKTKSFLLVFSLFGLSVALTLNEREMERGHYSAFCRSILADGDLNIVNQLEPSERWLVTSTLNHPTHIRNGGAVFWLPAVAYWKLVPDAWKPAQPLFGLSGERLALLVMNSLLALAGLVLLARALEGLAPDPTPRASSLRRFAFWAPLAATPFAWYLLFQPLNLEIAVFFMGALWLHDFVARAPRHRSATELGLGGAWVGLGFATKAIFIVLALPAAAELLNEIFRCGREDRGRRLVSFAAYGAGIAAPAFLMAWNNRIQSGTWILDQHSHLVQNFHEPWNFAQVRELFLSANGFLTSAPLILLITALAIRGCARTCSRSPAAVGELLGLPVVFLLLTMITSFGGIPTYPDELIARHYLFLLPAFSVILLDFLAPGHPDTGRRRQVAAVALLACALVNWIHIGVFQDKGLVTAGWPSPERLLSVAVGAVATVRERWSSDSSLANLALLAPLLFLAGFGLGKLERFARGSPERLLPWLSAIGSSAYLLITIANAVRNPIEVERLRSEGYFARSLVSTGSRSLNYYDEVASVYELGVRYLPKLAASRARAGLAAFTLEAAAEAGADPLGVAARLKTGEIRPSLNQ